MMVPLHKLVISEGELPMHWPAVWDLLTGARVDDRPIRVEPIDGGLYRILNGRHRFVVAVLQGKSAVRCTFGSDERMIADGSATGSDPEGLASSLPVTDPNPLPEDRW